MKLFTPAFKRSLCFLFLFVFLLLGHTVMAQDTEPTPTIYWKGTTSSDWGVGSNWSTGIAPGVTDEVIIGSTHFTGSNQPVMNETSVVTVRRITLTNESGKNAKLFITNNYNLVVTELLTIGAGTTFENEGSDVVVQGSIINNGSFLESEFIKNNGRKGRFYPSMEMSGTGTISGVVPMTISHLSITGSVTLEQNLTIRTRNIAVTGQNTPPTSDLTVVGTFNPGIKMVRFVGKGVSATTPADASNKLQVEAGGTLKVMASAYAQNYASDVDGQGNPVAMNAGLYTTSTVEYGSTTIDQDILPREYGILKISGKDRIKRLIGTTTVSNIDARTELKVESGTLDLQTFSLNRASGAANVAGGTITLANDAFLKIGGTGTFPSGYQAVSLGSTSTAEYYGANQTIVNPLSTTAGVTSNVAYGNLILNGTGAKIMPATLLTVAGDFRSKGAVNYTAGNNFTVLGDVNIGLGTTFDGSSRTITVGGNWTNNGTFITTTSTVVMNGANKEIRRTVGGVVPFHNLSLTAGQITTTYKNEGNPIVYNVDVEVFGNLITSGSGKFTSTANLAMSGTGSISGESITLQNLIGNGVTTTAAVLTINGNISVNGTKSLVATGGVINMMGSGVTINNSGSLQFFSLRILGTTLTTSNFNVFSNLSGTGILTATAGNISFTDNSTFGGSHMLYDVAVSNGKVLTPNANSILGIANTLTTTGATFNVSANTPNTVVFNKAGTQDVSVRDYYNLIVENTGTKTALGNLTILGDLTIKTEFAAGSHTHSIRGTFDNQSGAGFTAGAGTIKFDGSGNSIVKGLSTVFNVLEVNKSVYSNYLQLSNSIQTKDLIVGTSTDAAGEIRTGTNVLTVTGDRTGKGWIYGTIKRERTFAANTAYAFAAPYNTINLTTITGITAIAVTNTSGVINSFTTGSAVNRRYDVSINGGSNYAGTLQLQYNDAELNGNNEAKLQFFKSASSAGPWEVSDSTGRNTTQNWVANSALTDVRGSWTMSASSGILRWVGTTSSDWAIASNWQLGSNAAAQAPGAGDIVQFGGTSVINQPTLTTTTTVKAIQFLDNGSPITLTLGQGADLTISGNISANGSGSTSLPHAINLNNATAKLKVNGSFLLSGGTNNNISLNGGAGAVTVAGNIEQDNSSSVILGEGTLNIGGDYNYTSGTFTAGAESNVNYNGIGSQIIAPHNYHHLTISKPSGGATLTAGTVSINGNFNLTGSATVSLSVTNLTINGNVNLSNGSFDAGASTINVVGNWIRTLGSFTPSTSTVKFTGSTNASIGVVGGSETNYTFNKIAFEKTGSSVFTVNKDLRINADLDIASGTVNLGLLTVSRTAPGGNFTMGSTGKLLLENSNFPANFLNVHLNNSSSVIYQGVKEQLVAPVTYGNLSFANGGTTAKRLQATTTINGTLDISGNASLNGDGETITLKGTFNLITGGKFIAGSTYSEGTLVLAPLTPGVRIKHYLNGEIIVHNMLLETDADYEITDISGNGLTVKGDFNNQGAINGTQRKVTFEGNFINTKILKSSGVAAFSGTREQIIQLRAPIDGNLTNPITKGPVPPTVEFNGTVSPVLNSTAEPMFGSVVIRNTGGVRTSVNWSIYGELKVLGGAFHGGSYIHNIHTAITNLGVITSTGVINFEPLPMGQISDGVAMTIFPFYMGADSSYFQSTGTLRIGGSLPITLSGVIPAELNNLIFANTHAYGVRTYLYGASETSLSPKIPAITGTRWKFAGNLRVDANSSFTPGQGTSYVIDGNLTNNGNIKGANGDFILTNRIGQANVPKTPAIISGIGTTTIGNLTIETGAAVEINNIVTVQKDFTYKGASLQVNEGTLRFAGANNGNISSTSGMVSIGNMEVAKDVAAMLTLKSEIHDVYNLQVLSGTLDLTDKSVVKPIVLTGDASQAEIKVENNALLRVGGIGTTPQMQMDKYTFAGNSTVEYYNSSIIDSQTHGQVVLSEQYGNLSLSDQSTKNFATGHAKIAGELTIGAEAVVVTPETIEYNGSGAQTVAAINYKNLILSNAATKTLAAGTTGIANALTKAGTAELNAITNATTVNYNGAVAQAVLPASYYNLTLSNTGVKSFSGTTGIANVFNVASSGIADLNAAGNVVNFNGAVAQNIPGLAYKNLKVAGAGNKTLLADASAGESVIMGTGIILTGAHMLTIGNTASLIGETNDSYIRGKVVTARTFGTTSGNAATEIQGIAPQGVTATSHDFGNIGIQVSTTKDLGIVTVTRETGVPIISPTSPNQSIARNFTFAVTGANSDLDASVVFKYLDWELNSLQESDLRLSSYEGGKWVKQSIAAPDATTNTIGASVKTLTRITLGSIVAPLPVELLSFTAKKNGNNAELKWSTASEKDNAGFEVQVSTDGYTYQQIGFVESKVGSSSMKQEYSFTDSRNGKNGTLYYRLKQIDLDGTSKLYGPRTVDFGVIVKATPAEVYPNPFNDKLRVSLSAPEAGIATIKLYTSTGKLLKTVSLQVQAGLNDNPLPMAHAAYEPGLYLLVIELNGQQQTIKLMKE